MTRRRAGLAASFLAAGSALAFPGQAGPSAAYLELLRRYAAGERAAAVGALDRWGEKELQREFQGLRGAGPYTRADRARVQAAIMLHTDRAAFERAQAPVVEAQRDCGLVAPAAFAESLVGLLLVKGEDGGFARRWYLAMALQGQGELCLQDTLRWSEAGLKWFPRDAPLLLAQGTALEAADHYWAAPHLRVGAAPRDVARWMEQAQDRRATLELARRSLEEALAASPELHEARLRLGRVFARQGRGEEAAQRLEELLGRTTDASLRYLGHLFLGRVHEDAGRLGEAEIQYRAALGVDPAAQAAAVALSHLLLPSGTAGAREAIGYAVRQAPRSRRDAYWTYHLGRAHLAEGLLEELRRETLQ